MSPAPDTHPALPRGAVAALSVAAFASGISLRVTDAMLPRLAQEFGVALGTAASVVTAFSVAYGISQLFFGPLGDRYGKYRVVAWACLACALTAGACALAPDFGALLLARALAGATAAALIPLSMAWIGDVIPYEQRQPVLARFLIGQIVGLSSGVLLGGYAADHWHWRTPFMAIVVLFVMVGLVLQAVMRRLPPHALAAQPADGAPRVRMWQAFGDVVRQPWARVVLLTVFAEGAFLYGAFAYMVAHLHGLHGLSLARAGEVVMLFGLGGFLFAVLARVLVPRLGEAGLALWGSLLVCAAYGVVALARPWGWAVPAAFLAGMGFYMLHNTLQINATQMAPERRGAAVSAFAASFFIGQSVGVAVDGRLIAWTGTTGVLLLGGVGVLAVGLNFGRLKRRRNRH